MATQVDYFQHNSLACAPKAKVMSAKSNSWIKKKKSTGIWSFMLRILLPGPRNSLLDLYIASPRKWASHFIFFLVILQPQSHLSLRVWRNGTKDTSWENHKIRHLAKALGIMCLGAPSVKGCAGDLPLGWGRRYLTSLISQIRKQRPTETRMLGHMDSGLKPRLQRRAR